MKQTEKKEVVNFIQATLADGHPKTGTQLMELFADHAGLQEYNRKNLKQVFHRVSLSLADRCHAATRCHSVAIFNPYRKFPTGTASTICSRKPTINA
jgi:hypothetical protein